MYSKSFDQHFDHLRTTFEACQFNQLYVKNSKCTFVMNHMEFLGHIISGEGVSIDLKKIAVMVDWPRPTIVKSLRGFLG